MTEPTATPAERATAYETGDPPPHPKVKTAGLPPMRARLVLFAKWQDTTAQALTDAIAGRVKLIEALGGVAVTEARIDDMVKADTAGLLGWVRSRFAALTPEQIRSFEREKLEEQIGADRHKAEVARAALAEIEEEIAELEAGGAVLAARKDVFVRDAVIEAAGGIAADYLAHVEGLRECFRRLSGLNQVASTGMSAREFTVPTFTMPEFVARGATAGGIAVALKPIAARKAADPWRTLSAALANDPLADPRKILDFTVEPDELRPSTTPRDLELISNLRATQGYF